MIFIKLHGASMCCNDRILIPVKPDKSNLNIPLEKTKIMDSADLENPGIRLVREEPVI
jgi:hypothetical protein